MIAGIVALTVALLGVLATVDDTHEAHYRYDAR